MSLSIQQWDPYAILAIDKSRTRCYGWAPTQGRPCHNPVAGANLGQAQRLLAKISRYHPSSSETSVRLDQIAHLLLCRYRCRHQDQATSVVGEWKEKISDFADSIAEDEDDETPVQEEHTEDLRVQMAECQRLLTRVATALSTHQDAQLQFEGASIATETSPNTLSDQYVQGPEAPNAPEEPRPVGTMSEERIETEPQSTQLNPEHVQTLVRQLTLEHEASQHRRSRVVRFEEDNNTETGEGSTTSLSSSPGTMVSSGPSPEPSHLHSEQGLPDESHLTTVSPSRTSELVGGEESSVEGISPETATTVQSDTSWGHNALRYHLEVNKLFDRSHISCSRLIKNFTSPRWLVTLILYLGIFFVGYWIRGLKATPVELLGIEGPTSYQIGATAEQIRSTSQSLAVLKS